MNEEQLQKEILFHEGRRAYWMTTNQNPFSWDINAMIAESEARIKTAKELLKLLSNEAAEKENQ